MLHTCFGWRRELSLEKVKYFVTKLKDINYLEAMILIILCLISMIFGFYPEPLLNTMDISVNEIIQNHQNELIVNLINK